MKGLDGQHEPLPYTPRVGNTSTDKGSEALCQWRTSTWYNYLDGEGAKWPESSPHDHGNKETKPSISLGPKRNSWARPRSGSSCVWGAGGIGRTQGDLCGGNKGGACSIQLMSMWLMRNSKEWCLSQSLSPSMPMGAQISPGLYRYSRLTVPCGWLFFLEEKPPGSS